ncbi:MAG: MAPEG family protein [Rhodobacteraceae bacterium]|jgi:uncharacterized MAPEG superfamily protein|nr:MAPEG family protein [Paracoccaceae bacterium]
MTEHFAQYGHAITSLAAVALMTLLLGPFSAMRKTALGLAPGAEPPADYGNAAYRWHRAHGNLTESLGAFTAVTLAAILAGVSPVWVNLLASGFVAVRLLLAVVHIKGIGKPDMGVRSFTYVAGWLMCLCLAVMAILKVFSGG